MGIMMKKRDPPNTKGNVSCLIRFGQDLWIIALIPDSTIYSFLRDGGQYWAVGTQVMSKDKPGAVTRLQRRFIRQMAKNGLMRIQMFQHASFTCALRATKRLLLIKWNDHESVPRENNL